MTVGVRTVTDSFSLITLTYKTKFELNRQTANP